MNPGIASSRKKMDRTAYTIHQCHRVGHFLPEEDDKFLERVRAAVEEEERQSMAAADTDAAKDAIATIEVSREHIKSHAQDAKEPDIINVGDTETQDQKIDTASSRVSKEVAPNEYRKPDAIGPDSSSAFNSVANLPMEFYHYYHGSNTDMGTLIEVIPISIVD